MNETISVIGSGYVGLTTALMFCELGYRIISVDNNPERLDTLRQGAIPIYEPGLEELLEKHYSTGSIMFTDDIAYAVKESRIIYIAVGTPSTASGSTDLMYVQEVAESIGEHQNSDKIVVTKSTVPVGTGEKVKAWSIAKQKKSYQVEVVSNPEFLREGRALYDALNPDRIVIGSESKPAAQTIKRLYHKIDAPKIITNLRTAELIKYTSNAFLATKISFINEISRICDAYGVDVNDVSLGVGLDSRIGPHFLQAGIGWGGSCFPKDLASLIYMAKQAALKPTILQAAQDINREQIDYYLKKLSELMGELKGKTISVLGVAFKPHTDDIREAPALKVIPKLVEQGANVNIYDPIALKHVENKWEKHVQLCHDPEEAIRGSDCLFLLTDWPGFLQLDWQKVYTLMHHPLIIDGRNALDSTLLVEIGFTYYGVGRAVVQ